MIDQKKVWEALEKCNDPELHMDIVYLGLVYEAKETEEGKEFIKMTFTSPGCPYGPILLDAVKEEVAKVDGVRNVEIELVFEPPWSPPEDVKMSLGLSV